MDNTTQIILVKDIDPTASDGYYDSYLQSSSPGELTQFNDLLYFAAKDESAGRELWVSDGTAEGTQIVADIRANDSEYSFANSSNPSNFIEFKDRLYFTATADVSGNELWVTDGTTEETQLVSDINQNDSEEYGQNSSFAQEFTVVGDELFFTAEDENGRELWVSDGTTDGTKLVLDINPGTTNGYFYPFEPRIDNSFPQDLTAVGDKLYFAADDGENGKELWVSDGTTDGTKLVKDINSGFDDSEYLYSKAGKSRRIENPIPLDSNPYELTEFNDLLYFAADDGENGTELWVSDGTAEGTQLLVDLNPGNSEYGSPNSSYPGDFIQFQDRLYFSADNGEQGQELWVTDGTAEGTELLKDINPNTTPDSFGFVRSDSDPRNFIEFDDKLFFTAEDGSIGQELWVTDGTTEGTQLVKDIDPSIDTFGDGEIVIPQGSYIYEFTEFAGRLYFTADTQETGRELWVTNGTTEGTQLVEDLRPGVNNAYDSTFPYSSSPSSLTVLGNELFFSADNGETGTELFKLTADDFDSESEVDSTSVEATGSASISENGNSSSSSSSSSSKSSSSSSTAVVIGGNGTLRGGTGNDRLTGSNGDDLFDGGFGQDTLEGGDGNDIFALRVGDGSDTIVDFSLGSDRLRLVDGLQFDDLTLTGHSILAGDEVLANLNGIDTASLTASDFEVI